MASQREEEAEQQYQRDSIPARRSEQVCVHGNPLDSSFVGECGFLPAHGSSIFGGLDLNSQTSFMDLMHSTSSDLYEEGLPEFVAGGARGGGRVAGAGQRVDRAGRSSAGRGGRISSGRAGRGGRRGRVPVLGLEEAAGGRGAGRGCGIGRSGQTGRSSSLPYRVPRASSGSMEIEGVPGTEDEPEDSHFHDQYYDGVGDDESNDDIDKAKWTNSENTAAFCSLCVEEITAGNKSNGFMTARGYKNIAIKFEQNRGLRHSRIQFKNIWEELKCFYSFWLRLNKQTGLGRSPSGGIVASDEFWKKHTKGHAAWRKLKYGPPENLSELEIMFEHTAVDGSTSCVVGEQMDDEGDIGEEGGDEADVTPLSVSNKKRSSNNTATVISPKKKIKSPMVRIMKGMYEEMKETNAAAQKAMQDKVVQAEKVLQEKKDSITKCMSLAVECGALEGSAEHFMAGTLFMNWSSDDLFEYSSSDDGVVSLYGSDVEDDTVQFARQTLKRHAAVACMIGSARGSEMVHCFWRRKGGSGGRGR
ncbi:hypothetical protein D1007_19720 [Hordeum vulgare]|nr:hypothetical protein D1007_19720 [Hordeum vulgare]